MHLLNKIAACLVLAGLLPAVAVAESAVMNPEETTAIYDSAEALLDAGPASLLTELLAALDHLTADYRQENLREAGRVWVQRPGRFRIEADAPLSQTIVSDGETLWTWDRDLEQVIVSDLSGEITELPILLFAGDPEAIAGRYAIDRFEDGTKEYFTLHPMDTEGLLKTVTLVFQAGLPTRIAIETRMDEQTYIQLLNVTRTPAEPAIFQLALPPETDVIDDRAPAT